MNDSRYFDYDADYNCIVGFNDDGIENNMIITGNIPSCSTKLSPVIFNVELCGDAQWNYSKRSKPKPMMVNVKLPKSRFPPMYGDNSSISPQGATHTNCGNYGKRTPSPISPQSPATNINDYNNNNNNNNCFPPMPYGPPNQQNMMNMNMNMNMNNMNNMKMMRHLHEKQMKLRQIEEQYRIYEEHKREEEQKERERELTIAEWCREEIYEERTDKFVKEATKGPLIYNTALKEDDTVIREDENNGSRYETYGSKLVTNSCKWKFILHKTSNGCISNMIIGLIDADINGQQTMEIYLDTKDPMMATLYKNGIPEQGMVIEILYNVTTKELTVKNSNEETPDQGLTWTFRENIDTSKRYRLNVSLYEPATITMVR